MSGYFEIGIYQTKIPRNVGTLWRSAYQLGAAGIFTIGRRYDHRTSSDNYNAPNNIPLRHHETIEAFLANLPLHSVLVGIELGGIPLSEFVHPRNALYLLGADDTGLPRAVLAKCSQVVSLQAISQPAYNVAVAGSIVLYHRVYWQDVNRLHRGRETYLDHRMLFQTEEPGMHEKRDL